MIGFLKKENPGSLGWAGLSSQSIVAIRGESGSYNRIGARMMAIVIVAIRGESGSYNAGCCG